MPYTIKELINLPEGKTLELKRDLSSPRNIMKTLVAFANTAGGRLIIGVENDSKQIVGFDNPLDEEEKLCNLIADLIEPRLVPTVELSSLEDKTLLAVEVFPSASRPHWLKSEGSEQGVYVRLGSTNRKADSDLITELRRSVTGSVFDEQPLPELSMDALDIPAAKKCFLWITEPHSKRFGNVAFEYSSSRPYRSHDWRCIVIWKRKGNDIPGCLDTMRKIFRK